MGMLGEQQKANMERSREAAGEQKRQMDIAYQKKSMAEFFANRAASMYKQDYIHSFTRVYGFCYCRL